jgi:hypothetical protein
MFPGPCLIQTERRYIKIPGDFPVGFLSSGEMNTNRRLRLLTEMVPTRHLSEIVQNLLGDTF